MGNSRVSGNGDYYSNNRRRRFHRHRYSNVVIDFVTIKPDGGSNKVVFESTGKEWYCINQDIIYDEAGVGNRSLYNRSLRNFIVNPSQNIELENTEKRFFTDDEIKLLYAIDPHGVASYIQFFGDYLCDGLENVLSYKDRMFRLLFNKEPVYFDRDVNGVWFVTDKQPNASQMVSESEAYFGMHQVYDEALLKDLIDIAVGVVQITVDMLAYKYPAFKKVSGYINSGLEIAKFGVLIACGVEHDFAKEAASIIVDEAVGNTLEDYLEEIEIAWLQTIINFCDSLNSIGQTLGSKPSCFKRMVSYYVYDIQYCVSVELSNGEIHKMYDINETIAQA